MTSLRIAESRPLPPFTRIWVILLLAPSAWLDFIPWTGLFIIDEYLIWATCLGIIGWLLVRPALPQPRPYPPDTTQNLVLGLLAITWTVALMKVWWPMPPIGPNTFWSYLEPGNAIRIWLGIAIALMVIPVMNAMWRTSPDSMARTMSFSILVAALGAGMILLWERIAFPGLLNFSSDYRTTGFFSDMRVGGAALDGYLSLVVPFVLVAALSARNLRAILINGMLFALMVYAVMSTFSRALQLAVILSSLLVLVAMTRSRILTGDTAALPVKGGSSVVAGVTLLCALLFYTVFAHGGYRGLLAVLCCVLAVLYTIREEGWKISGRGLAAAIAAGVTITAVYFVPYKGPYFAFALAFLVWLTAAATRQFNHTRRQTLLLPLTLPMAMAAAGVSFHWGGVDAGSQTTAGLLFLYAAGFLVGLPRIRPKIQPRNLFVALLAGIMLAVISVPVLSNYRMTERMGTTGTDWEGRIRHWQGVRNLMHQDWTGMLLGEGLGTFPAAYYIAHYTGDQQAEKPGGIRREYESSEHFIRSFKAGGPNEWGEPLQLIQRISVTPDETLTISGLVRTGQQGVLSLIVCEKWLLYHENCVNADIKTVPDNTWQPFTVTVKTPPVSPDNSSILPRFASLSVFGSPVTDIDRLSMVNQSGKELLRNGSFENGMFGWFVASDHTHMPWHTKNMAVGVFFDGGLVLLGTFCLLGLLTVIRLTPRVLAGDHDCISHAAALLGFGIVASFDTVIDAPRVAFLFLILTASALSVSWHRGKQAVSDTPGISPSGSTPS